MDLIFISSTILLSFGPILRQFGAEKEGNEDPVSSLLSLLIVFLITGRSAGRLMCSSNHRGGEGWKASLGLLLETTGMG